MNKTERRSHQAKERGNDTVTPYFGAEPKKIEEGVHAAVEVDATPSGALRAFVCSALPVRPRGDMVQDFGAEHRASKFGFVSGGWKSLGRWVRTVLPPIHSVICNSQVHVKQGGGQKRKACAFVVSQPLGSLM